MTRVLVADDDPAELRLLCGLLADAGFEPLPARGGDEALALLRGDTPPSAMLLDLVMPDRDGMGVLDAMLREAMAVPVIVLGAEEAAMPAIRRGAADYVTRPVRAERLLVSLRNALRLAELEGLLRCAANRRSNTPVVADLVATGPAMARVVALIGRAARSPLPVLLEGEAGTGKALAARIIHATSERSARPFVAFDCAAIARSELEAELFGDTRDSREARPGRLRAAQGGTLYLSEIGALPPGAQARLLRLVETGDLAPDGGRPERVNVRIIAGTRTRLLNLARAGQLREDLFYRLNVMPIYLPPLRQRPDDVAPLARRMQLRAAAETGRRSADISPEATALLAGYTWPGNLTQLDTMVCRAVALSQTGRLEPCDFPQLVRERDGRDGLATLLHGLNAPSAPVHVDAGTLPAGRSETGTAMADRFVDASGEVSRLSAMERELIAFALERHDGHMSRSARTLGIGRSTLYRKIREYGLEAGLSTETA